MTQAYQAYKQELIDNEKACDFAEYIPDDDDDDPDGSCATLDESTSYPIYITQFILNSLKILITNCRENVFDRRIDVVPMPKFALRELVLDYKDQYFGTSNENYNDNDEKNSDYQLRFREFPSGNVKSLNVPLDWFWGWLNNGIAIESHRNDIVVKVKSVEFGWRRYKHHFYLILYFSKNEKDSNLQQTI